VIIACAIFFVVAFAILQLVTSSLVAAKALQQREPDPGMIAASLSLSNILEDGLTLTGDFEDLAPGLYKGYRWMAEANEVSSNSLFQVDIVVYRDVQKKGPAESKISILRYAPGSKPGRAFGTGATGGR
jgi:hypothetical protein